MKKTVFELDDITTVEYYHSSGEAFIRQDTRHTSGGRVEEINLDASEVVAMIVALGELRAVIEADKISELESAA